MTMTLLQRFLTVITSWPVLSAVALVALLLILPRLDTTVVSTQPESAGLASSSAKTRASVTGAESEPKISPSSSTQQATTEQPKASPASLAATKASASSSSTLGAGGHYNGREYVAPDFTKIKNWEDKEFVIPPGKGTYVVYRRNFRNLREPGPDGYTQCVSNPSGRSVHFKQCNGWTKNHFYWSPASATYAVTYEDCNFEGIQPQGDFATKGRVHDQDNCRYFKVTGCYVKGMGGWLVKSMAPNATVIFERNIGVDIDGRFTQRLKTGTYPQYPYGRVQYQLLQVAGCRQPAVFRVEWNRTKNHPDRSYVEDTYSLYDVKGTDEKRLLVRHNFTDGAYVNPSVIRVIDKHYPGNRTGDLHGSTGGNIMLEKTDFALVEQNVCVRSNIYSYGIGGGQNNIIQDNIGLNGGVYREGINEGGYCPWANCAIYNIGLSRVADAGNKILRNKIGGVYWHPHENHKGPIPPNAHDETWKPAAQWVIQRNDYGTVEGNPLRLDNLFFAGVDAQNQLIWSTRTNNVVITEEAENIAAEIWWSRLARQSFRSGPRQ